MNMPLDTQLFDRAAIFAIKAHAGTERRGKAFPYIIHPMEAASIVSSITNDPELLAAAILHDTIEDTGVTEEQIRNEFGDRVANLVKNETSQMPKGTPWRTKRQSQIAIIVSASRDSKIVAIGDKLSNMRAIANDYSIIGDEVFNRFHAPNGKMDIEWYYRELANALQELNDTLPYKEFLSLIDKTFSD